MLPNLSTLQANNSHHGSSGAKLLDNVGVILDAWSEREELLTSEQLRKLPMSYQERDAECAICFERLRDPSPLMQQYKILLAIDNPLLSCGHAFHLDCAISYFDKQRDEHADTLKCPVCRQPFVDAFIDKTYNRVNGRRKAAPPAPPDRRVVPERPILPAEYDYHALQQMMRKVVEALRGFDYRVASREIMNETVEAYKASRQVILDLLRDVRDARNEGESWRSIFRALMLAEEEPEG